MTDSKQCFHSGIYRGTIWHRRLQPKEHQFSYNAFMVYLDLDEVDAVMALSRWWSTNRFALAQFRRRDYFYSSQQPLKSAVADLVFDALGRRVNGSVRMLTNLRYFGFLINPITAYYCFTETESLDAVVLEVTNTPWGEQTHYVLDCRENSNNASDINVDVINVDVIDVPAIEAPSIDAAVSQGIVFKKSMHVSPFLPMNMIYCWRGLAPSDGKLRFELANFCAENTNENLSAQTHSIETQHKVFDSRVNFKREPISGELMRSILLRYPLMTMKVFLAIHWQALRLFLKRVKLYRHPKKNALESEP